MGRIVMKQFNLEEYLKNPSKKIMTMNGGIVTRFLCTDARGQYPIVALVEALDDDEESAFSYTKDGHFYPGEEHDNDLFFVPEKHEGWFNIYPQGILGGLYDSREEARRNGGETAIATLKIEWEE